MPAWEITDTVGVYKGKSGNFIVRFKVHGKEKYFGTFQTIGEARTFCITKRKELGLNINPPRKKNGYSGGVNADYLPAPNAKNECLRCSLPHLPDSVYCKYHKKRYEEGAYGEDEDGYIRARKVEILRLQAEWESQQLRANLDS